MNKHGQSINQSLASAATYFNSNLAAGLVGGVATGVLRWNAPGTITGQGLAEIGTLADDGTVVAISQPGVYSISTQIVCGTNADNVFAICLGPTATTNVAEPHYVTSQGVIRRAQCFDNIGNIVTVDLEAVVTISLATSKVTASVNGANAVRVRGVVTGGGGPPVAIATLDTALIITKIGEFRL